MHHSYWSTLFFVATFFIPACSDETAQSKGTDPNTVGNGGANNGSSTAVGGGTSATPGTSGTIDIGTGTGGSGGQSSCGLQTYERERNPTEILLVLDRSASMQDPPGGGTEPKWDLTIPAVIGVVNATNAGISWGLKLYPESQDTEACAPETIVPTIHVPVAIDNAKVVVDAINATSPEGDGTPTGDAIKFATAHLTERLAVNNNQKFILLATDGDPSCPSDDASGYAVDAISAALAAGFPTFVVGVDTTKTSSIKRLNAMAQAGGRARTVAEGSEEPTFYLASTQNELETALSSITTAVASCVFDLEPPPPVPDNIAVDFNGTRAERDAAHANGWDYTKSDFTQLEIFGAYCDTIKNAGQNQVKISYGCPNVPIPPIQ